MLGRGAAEGNWKRQSCFIFTLAPKLIFSKGLMQVIKEIEAREIDFRCAVIAKILFADYFYYSKLEDNCMNSSVFSRKNENLCHVTVQNCTCYQSKSIFDKKKS